MGPFKDEMKNFILSKDYYLNKTASYYGNINWQLSFHTPVCTVTTEAAAQLTVINSDYHG